MIDAIEKILDLIAKVIKAVLAAMLGVMLIVSIVEVGRRYFLGLSFSWSEELVRYLIIWVSFLGAAVVFKDGGLVCFDVVLNKLKGNKKKMLLLVINTICVGFVAYMFWNSVSTVMKPSIVNQKSIGLQVSMLYPYLALPVGLGLMLIYGLWHYVEIFTKKGCYKLLLSDNPEEAMICTDEFVLAAEEAEKKKKEGGDA